MQDHKPDNVLFAIVLSPFILVALWYLWLVANRH